MKRFMRMLGIVALLLTGAMAIAQAAASDADGGKARVVARTEIWKAITAGNAGSASVAIMECGRLIYAEGFGMADRETSKAVDKDTLFNIGSISKVHCTLAVLLLVDDGKVRLDGPVSDYLPEFTMADERYKDITVRMLLNHSSGLPGTVGPNSFGFAYHADFYKDVLDILSKSNLKHRPGEMAIYCNDGFTLAEMIVARVADMPYEKFVAQRILAPLGLTKTGLGVGQRPATAAIAKYYTADGKREPAEVVSLLGSGGLAATPEDLCKFADCFSADGHPLLSPRLMKEITAEQPTPFSDKLQGLRLTYGLGWDFANIGPYKEQGLTVLGKTGGTGNYTSMLYAVPQQRIAVAVLATGAHSGAAELADAVLAAYLTERGLLKAKEELPKPPRQATPLPDALREYDGYYSNGNELLRLRAEPEQGMLNRYALDGAAETTLPALLHDDGRFYSAGKTENNALYFTKVEGTSYLMNRVAMFGVDMVASEKLPALTEPKKLRIDVDGKQWLRRNVKAYEGTGGASTHLLTSHLLDALPGYVDFGGIKRIDGAAVAGAAVHSTRDLTELRLLEKDGDTWAWLSGMLFMPAERAKKVSIGRTNIVIGAAGYNEWLQLECAAVVLVVKPEQGRVIVFDGGGAVLFDSALTSGAVFAPAGSRIELAGSGGDPFAVSLRLP